MPRSVFGVCFSLPSSVSNACVAEQQKHLTVNQASLVDFVGASPTTCTKDFGRVA